MKFTALHRNPFLRLLIPFVAGIFCGDEWFFSGKAVESESFFLWLFGAAFLLLAALFRLCTYSMRWLFGAFLFICLLGLGAGCTIVRLQAGSRGFGEQEAVHRVVLTDRPEVKENSILCRVESGGVPAHYSIHYSAHHSALLYLSKDSLSEQLVRGDELLVCTRFSLPDAQGNPDEFDYARYLVRKGISGTGFARSGYWKRTGHTEEVSFRRRSLDYREHVLDIYRSLGFDQESFAVLSALTVGYKEELGEEIRESYSVAGASHVLALSGLHIGFLYALLFLCLKRLPGHWKGVAFIRAGVIIGALWAFAFFTGLSPSVVRSVCMFSLFALAGLSEGKHHSINTLSATAFLMLLCCPGWLFDVGFQLSFLAVASILLIYPLLYRLLPVSGRVGKYIWGLICVSLAAQVATAPLVIYYFSRFSNHFLLTNLLVIPLVSLIMYAAVVVLALTPFPFLQSLAGSCLKGLVEFLNTSVRWVEHLPGASADGLWISPFELPGIYLLLFLGYLVLDKCSGKRVLGLLGCLCLVSGIHVALSVRESPHRSLVFYNIRNCSVVHCVLPDRSSWLVYADTFPDTSLLRRTMARHWNRLKLESPHELTPQVGANALNYHEHLFSFAGCRVCVLCDDSWSNKASDNSFPVDYLYICRGYTGHLEELVPLFAFRQVILDASLSAYYRQLYKTECFRLGIPCHSLSDEGSVQFVL